MLYDIIIILGDISANQVTLATSGKSNGCLLSIIVLLNCMCVHIHIGTL